MLHRRTRSVFATILVAVAAVVAFPLNSLAQTFRGGINGTVTDQSGAVVPGATVEATDSATGVSHKTITSSAGEYSFQDMQLGKYVIKVSTVGFKPSLVKDVPVTAGVIYTLPVKLSIETTGETVEVSASSLALDTTSTTQTTVIPETTVQNIPLNGRDFTQMIGMAPGFAGYALGGFGSVNGTRGNQVNWQIDGADNNDWWHNIPAVNQGGVENIAGVTLPIDSIEEFSLQTQSSAEVGRNPGGSVNLVTKSGTNAIHGSAYYYERNQALAVTNPFNTLGDLPLENVQWGASLGGPFWKDHSFWFTNFEKQKFNIATGNSGLEPNQYYQAAALQLLSDAGVPVNPATQQLLTILWPANLLAGTTPGFFQSAAPEFGYSYNGVAKIDHTFNSRNSIYVRAFMGQGNQTAPVGTTDINPYFFEIGPIHVYNYSAGYNWVISPSITNSVTAAVNYFHQTFSDANPNFASVPEAGFVTGSRFPNAPNILIGNDFEPTGNTPPEGRQDITGVIDDALNIVKGKHQFRLGGEFRRAQVDEFYWRHSNGNYQFLGGQGPNGDGSTSWNTDDQDIAALADFLAGYLTKASIAVGNPERLVFSYGYTAFAQDSYQATTNLNFNFGLRYDFMQPMHDSKKDLSVFRPGLTTTGIAFQGADISNIYAPTYTSFSPRLGFSYSPPGSKATVIRGGAGMFFDTPNANPFLDNRPGNSAPNGLEGNPGGSNPVYTLTTEASEGSPALIVPGEEIIPTSNLSCTINPCGVFSVDKNFRSPYNINYNLQIERQVGKAFFQLGYVGSQGRKLLSLLNINQPYLGGAPGAYVGDGTEFGGNYYSDINQIESIGTSNYNSLQAVFRTSSWHGVLGQASYTWGHNLDEVTAYRGALPQDSYNFKGDYGNSDFDTRNGFKGYVNYAIPAAPTMKLLTGGWELNTAFAFNGGQPITVYNGDDTSGTNEYTQRVNRVSNPFQGVSHSIQTVNGNKFVQWFNPNAYVEPPANTWGTEARNSIYGPGFEDVDLSVIKNTRFPINDFPVNVQFRAEMFNLFNHVNLASPACTQLCNDYFGGSSFGRSGSTIGSGNFSPGIGPGEPFNVQLAMKILF
ncbi:MAG: carboxypeptidase regulatory-like domain-containing protein [Terracidiphilus sp.]